MTSINIKRIIANVEDLPTLSRTIFKITETINNPQSSAKDLAEVITDDQILTARLLRLVNSAFYGFPQRISTVTEAVILLGFDAIRNLLLTTSVFDIFIKGGARDSLSQEELWDHSLGCAVGAKAIGSYLLCEKVEELFVAGLLHDIGKIVEMIYLRDDFAKVLTIVSHKNIPIVAAEDYALGYNHAQVGELLAKRWNLPPKLVSAIAHHHQPRLAGEFSKAASIVHLADILCRALCMGSGGDNKIPPLEKNAWDALSLTRSSIDPIMDNMETEYEELSSFRTLSCP